MLFVFFCIIISTFEYNSSTFLIYHFNIYIMRFKHLFKNVELVFQSVELVFFPVLNEFGKNVESSTAATGVEKHIGI